MLERIKLLLIILLSPFVLGPDAHAATGGLVIYKAFSFDSDSQAQIANYSSYEHFPFVDNVLTPDGQTLRILSGQDPVYIARPGDPGTTAEQAIPTILHAEKRFPQFAPKLEQMRQAWTLLPKAAASVKSSPLGTPLAKPSPVIGGSGNVLHTKSGEVFHAWSISAFEGNTVVIKHADGISRVPISDLQDSLGGYFSRKETPAVQPRQRDAAEIRSEAGKASPHLAASPTPQDGKR